MGGKNFKIVSQCRKTGGFGIFQHPFCRKTSKKCRGPFGEKISAKKCLAVPKKIERVLPGIVCYAEKQGKPFWSSLLGQMVQFDTIIFGRTFKDYFGQFVWIENQSRMCGKGVGLGLFLSEVEKWPFF